MSKDDALHDQSVDGAQDASPTNAAATTNEQAPHHYEVGYARPPLRSRWKPGQSGNKAGRPIGRHSLKQMIKRSFLEKVSVTNGGLTHRLAKIEVALKQLANKAAGGDLAATRLAMEIYREACPDGSRSEPMRITIIGGLPVD